MEKIRTGLASIDMPWLQQYDDPNCLVKKDFDQNQTVWSAAKKILILIFQLLL